MPALAETGSGESPVGLLETVSPVLSALTVLSESSMEVTFSEAMLPPGVTEPTHYSVSGPGKGTLTTHPDTATGNGPYALVWQGVEMQDGMPVMLTVSGVQDAVGNAIGSEGNSFIEQAIGEAPVFSNLTVMPPQIAAGDKATIRFNVSETLSQNPQVQINGRPAIWISGGNKAEIYMYEYTATEADVVGMAEITISGTDLAGNTGYLNSVAALEILQPALGQPLRLWPWVIALLAAGLFHYVFRKRRSVAFVLAVMGGVTVTIGAFAQGPAVSNVAFLQRPEGNRTVVDISYDLVAPGTPCLVNAALSLDGGADGYPYPISSVTGDVLGITSGTGKHILWDIYADYPEQYMSQARIKVTAVESTPVVFQNRGLEQKVRDALGLAASDLLCMENLANLTVLDIDSRWYDEFGTESYVTSLEGLQYATNLRFFSMTNPRLLWTIDPISALTQLEYLALPEASYVGNFSPITPLVNLRYLDLHRTSISNLTPLSGMSDLQHLDLEGSSVSTVSVLSNLTNLEWLNLGDNHVSDLTPLSELSKLSWLNLSYNGITSLAPLLTGAVFSGPSASDELLAHGNPFIQSACDFEVPELESRGIDVAYTPCGEAVGFMACYESIENVLYTDCCIVPSSDPVVEWKWYINWCLGGPGVDCTESVVTGGPTLDVGYMCDDYLSVILKITTASGSRREMAGQCCVTK